MELGTEVSLGVTVSGIEGLPGFLQAKLEGPEIITGGAFGPENSVITLVLVLILSAMAYYLTLRRGNVMQMALENIG